MAKASAVITALADKVDTYIQNGDGYGRSESVLRNLKSLQSCLEAIRPVVLAAESRITRKPHRKLTKFISLVRRGAHTAEDVLDKLEYRILQRTAENDAGLHQVRHFVTDPYCLVERYLSSRRNLEALCGVVDGFDTVAAGLQDLVLEFSYDYVHDDDVGGDNYEQDTMPERQATDRCSGSSNSSNLRETELVGRVAEKEIILKFLQGTCAGAGNCSDITISVQVLPIVGAGGVGKTSLARWAYDNPTVRHHFDLKAWVLVSQRFEPKRLMAKILESASVEPPDQDSHNTQDFDSIRDVLQRGLEGKKFLLVLDDVWNEERREWEILLDTLRFGKQGSRVLITTRGQRVARITGTVSPFDLKPLAVEDCWSILRKYAFGDENILDHPQLTDIAREIVKRLGGSPLAAKMLGSLLKSNFNVSYWMSILHSRLLRTDDDQYLRSALQLCFEELPGNLKQCFAYCSLFPKDYGFEEDRLIQEWMAHGYVVASEEKKLEDIGRDYFDELFQRSFFEKKQYQQGYVIHDTLHDIARIAANGECLVVDGYRTWLSTKWVRHLHVRAGNYLERIPYSSHEMKHIRSLIVEGPFDICNLEGILRKFEGLRVLVLSQVCIGSLPEYVGELIHLRYLVLHRIDVADLPESVCRLYHLQGIDVRYCANLLSLPKELHKLVNLRHLKL